MNYDENEYPLCDDAGICEAPEHDRGLTNCVHCGKELVEVNGVWLTWDYKDYEYPMPQGYVKLPSHNPN